MLSIDGDKLERKSEKKSSKIQTRGNKLKLKSNIYNQLKESDEFQGREREKRQLVDVLAKLNLVKWNKALRQVTKSGQLNLLIIYLFDKWDTELGWSVVVQHCKYLRNVCRLAKKQNGLRRLQNDISPKNDLCHNQETFQYSANCAKFSTNNHFSPL